MAKNTMPLFADVGKFYVYIYRDPRPRKKMVPIYVGKGTAAHKRADVHWKEGARNPILRAVLAKIRSSGREPIVELVAWYNDEPDAFACEIALIAKFGRRNTGNGTLCNLTDGGDGPSGMKQSKEHMERLAELSRTRPRTEDQREKTRQTLKGHHVSNETRRKISEANKGRPISDEHRAKLSASQKRIMEDPRNREALSLAFKGRKLSPEACAKIGDRHRGKKVSDETKALIRAKRALQAPFSDEARRKMSASARASRAARKLRLSSS